MKRGRRDVDLALVSNEIAALTNQSTDPDLFEAYRVLLAAPEVVLRMLRDTPLRLINLMRTSKTLMQVLGQIPGLWIVLLESVLLQETENAYFVTIYPFIMMRHHRECVLLSTFSDALRRVQVLPMEHSTPDIFIPGKEGGRRAHSIESIYTDSYFREFPAHRFGVVAHTLVVQLISEIALLNNVIAPWVNYGSAGGVVAQLGSARADEHWRWHQGMDMYDSILILLSNDDEDEPHVKVGSLFRYDAQFVKEWIAAGRDAIATISHSALAEDSDCDVEIRVDNGNDGPTTHIVPFAVAQLLDEIKRRFDQLIFLERLQTETYDALELDPTPVAVLDETFVLPYRQMLYDPISGIYNTPEKQKALLFYELQQLSRSQGRDAMIEKYGEPFNFALCAHCEDETCLVSERLGLPFCSDACQKAHVNK